MSLINKMLQDLEERKSGSEVLGTFQGQVRAAPDSRSRGAPWRIILGAVCVVAAGISVGAWWMYGQQHEKSIMPAPQPVAPDLSLSLKLDHEPPTLPSSSSEAMSDPALPDDQLVQGIPAELQDTHKAPASQIIASAQLSTSVQSTQTEPQAAKQAGQKAPDAMAPASETWSRMNAAPESRRIQAAPATSGVSTKPLPESKEKAQPAESFNAIATDDLMPLKVSKQLQELTPQQRAENDYRRALGLIEQGRNKEAMNVLEQALQIDSRHAAARQTLAALLVDAKRPDDAVRRLNEGLQADRTQTGLAMMLARLQVDRQELRAAIETLQHTLPYAAGRADYHAFLAALLQREARHKEAIEHYLAALKKAPNNGIWWMGAAISLQAENRTPEARDAYTRAKMSGNLSPELLAFVEQKLAQMR
ncbi:tetratricopeptide repeat protein [Oxalobacteraceae bacterium R-40]|uniref:Tetratricopeptide repeat protein n=1 Tax=Keguizhuia sedimenti TaxID=3064264 RepID=A0ABU1BMK2_9BURK|nr:tetratricopeptide repeat protein [Oxalobacteraceae bacterium R-40]